MVRRTRAHYNQNNVKFGNITKDYVATFDVHMLARNMTSLIKKSADWPPIKQAERFPKTSWSFHSMNKGTLNEPAMRDRQTNGQTNGQTDRQTDWRNDRHHILRMCNRWTTKGLTFPSVMKNRVYPVLCCTYLPDINVLYADAAEVSLFVFRGRFSVDCLHLTAFCRLSLWQPGTRTGNETISLCFVLLLFAVGSSQLLAPLETYVNLLSFSMK